MAVEGATYCHRASADGEGGIGLVELYGPGAPALLREVFRPLRGALPGPGRAALGDVVADGEAFDEAVLTHLSPGESWSRLETWTIAVHGGSWLQTRLREVLVAGGAVELDRRAVLELAVAAGRLDPIRAAAYEQLLESTARRALSFFLRQYDDGELSGEAAALTGELASGDRSGSLGRATRLLAASATAQRLARPLRILLAGRPNAGKSTLFNVLLEEERAVVTSRPGTTRDLNEHALALCDFPFRLIDSAGLRGRFEDQVEQEGVERVRRALSEGRCDRILYLVPPPWRLEAADRDFLRSLAPEDVLLVRSKADLGEVPADRGEGCVLSAQSGEGLPELRRTIVAHWLGQAPEEDVPCAPFTPRLTEAFERTVEALRSKAELDGVRRLFLECLSTSWPYRS